MKENIKVGTNSCFTPGGFQIERNEKEIKTITKTVHVSLGEYCGEKLMTARKLAQLTQQDVEDKTGILRTTISKIEKARVGLTMETLYTLCGLYNCKSSDILPF